MNTPTPRRIESADNAFYRRLKKVLAGRGIRKEGAVLVSGPKSVGDVLRLLPERCEAWISAEGHGEPPATLTGDMPWYVLSRGLFAELDIFGTGAPLLLLRMPPIPVWDAAAPLPPGCTLLIPFQDPDNVGAAIRSAVAFDVAQVIMLAGSANPYHPKAIRASGGAVFHARLGVGPAVDALLDTLPLVPLSGEGRPLDDVAFPEPYALLPGVEGPGLPARFRARAVSIPISDRTESLNAAAATAIALYVWTQRRAR
ncbi:MAG TPA: TrmH family RNA methyltransferase [Candidatus Krumholzibacteria bacterium]|nr:TrmH family RNA methyltransferase [Candidatus Krumholzibacteria bacterium]